MTTEAHGFSALDGQQYMNLATFRKNGVAVKTPVWFAADGGKLYVMTIDDSGKIKRIRADSRVLVEPSDQRGRTLGPQAPGTARILPTTEAQRANDLINRKYGFIKKVFDLFARLNGSLKKRAYIEIEPAS
ncbi:MAG: PPOX class F420-dependent oxidoreductase [Roseiflexaceae bacterium]|nr:PPOX class F420-dependent oxidoreductase [Roseiflexaceae bacterium]